MQYYKEGKNVSKTIDKLVYNLRIANADFIEYLSKFEPEHNAKYGIGRLLELKIQKGFLDMKTAQLLEVLEDPKLNNGSSKILQ